MYVILVYDIEEGRVDKVNKFLKRYLYWIQNSVFEGELTESQFVIMKDKLKHLIDERKDSVIIYKLNWEKAVAREIIGVEKSSIDNII
ncbi:MAG: CRISPR-associated endonuclease Cas2 [Thermoplasmata archaeon]|jgi:CRISPR-associated protein Cas2